MAIVNLHAKLRRLNGESLETSTSAALDGLVRVRRALISVSDKSDLVPFASALASMDIEIISTGGTARALTEAGIAVTPIDAVTGFPEMMDGRVKTLHPNIHGGLLARRDNAAHISAMEKHGIAPIDLVCVNLYPFEKAILQENITERDAIEQIDIGGPSMVRSAAKNFDFVAVVTSPTQYDRVIGEMRSNDGSTTHALRRDLAAAAFSRTAEYDTAISAWMSASRPDAFPAMLRLNYALLDELRYGENPHQKAAVYADPASRDPSVVRATMLHGKPLSYNNLNDAAAALELVQDLAAIFPSECAAAIIKHANPCGAAVAVDAASAFERAYESDPLAAYGGILVISRPVNAAAAQTIAEGQRFLEVIAAPEFEGDAAAILGERWKNVRLLAVGPIARIGTRHLTYRSIPGGMLAQEADMRLARTSEWQHVAGPVPEERLLRDAGFIWIVTKHLRSNAIAIGRELQMLGSGMGQVDRVAACRLAIGRAGDRLTDAVSQRPAVAASDAFFPFPDGPQLLIDAGVKCIVHPGGSMRDDQTIALCNERGITCLLTGTRHFRH